MKIYWLVNRDSPHGLWLPVIIPNILGSIIINQQGLNTATHILFQSLSILCRLSWKPSQDALVSGSQVTCSTICMSLASRSSSPSPTQPILKETQPAVFPFHPVSGWVPVVGSIWLQAQSSSTYKHLLNHRRPRQDMEWQGWYVRDTWMINKWRTFFSIYCRYDSGV
jgi:hypothetical protein